MRDQCVAVSDRAMTRNDLGLRARTADGGAKSVQQSLQAATVDQINIGIADAAVVITGGENVVTSKADQRVTICMG